MAKKADYRTVHIQITITYLLCRHYFHPLEHPKLVQRIWQVSRSHTRSRDRDEAAMAHTDTQPIHQQPRPTREYKHKIAAVATEKDFSFWSQATTRC